MLSGNYDANRSALLIASDSSSRAAKLVKAWRAEKFISVFQPTEKRTLTDVNDI